MAESEARGGEGAETEAPDVDRPAVRDPVDQLGDVVGEALDRHGAAGVGCVAVALELDADHPAALGEPGEDVAEAAAEGEDAAVQGDERRSCRVAVLLVPDGDAVDLFVGHASPTVDARTRGHSAAMEGLGDLSIGPQSTLTTRRDRTDDRRDRGRRGTWCPVGVRPSSHRVRARPVLRHRGRRP